MQSSDSLVLQFMAQSNTISFLLQDFAGLESQEVPRVEAERHARKLIYKDSRRSKVRKLNRSV